MEPHPSPSAPPVAALLDVLGDPVELPFIYWTTSLVYTRLIVTNKSLIVEPVKFGFCSGVETRLEREGGSRVGPDNGGGVLLLVDPD